MTADPLESFETEEQNTANLEAAPGKPPVAQAAANDIEPAAETPRPHHESAPAAGSASEAPRPQIAPAEVSAADSIAEVSEALWSAAPGEPDPPTPNTNSAFDEAAVSQAIAELANTLEWGPGEAVPPTPVSARPAPPAAGMSKARISRKRIFLGFAAAFVVSALLGLLLVLAVAVGISESYANRILPGVRVGSVDVSGLSRDQAIAKLQSDLSYLGKGEVTVTTPVGTSTITYEQAGRGPDVQVMADAAMSVGHSGNLLRDAATLAHSAAYGQVIPIVVQLDPTAIAQSLRQVVGTSTIEPENAQATIQGGTFGVTAATTGYGIDERTIQSSIIDQLTQTGAPADLKAGANFTSVAPQISEKDAQDAIARAQRMIVDVHLEWSMRPMFAPANWKPSSWTIPSAEIRSWIVFAVQGDGSYGPAIDPALIATYVASLTAGVATSPTEPDVVWDSTGKPVSLIAGKDGLAVDPRATAAQVVAYLDELAGGGTVPPTLEIATSAVPPQIVSVDSLAAMVMVGNHTTVFYPDISNGMGKNIRQPALNLDGKVIGPGEQFSFLQEVGPIDEAHGFAMGGVILHGKSDHTGAMGGGICSASTTLFNAAANAGLQIDERHAHFYYIYRYPVGRDATVFSDGATTWDVKWTNDTPYPIVIRAWTTYGSKSTITIQFWSWPLNRTVTWTGGGQVDVVKAGENAPIYTDTLPAGQKVRAEYATDGFKTSVTRVVTDATGKVLHDDTWGSSYSVVNGQLLIGTGPATP